MKISAIILVMCAICFPLSAEADNILYLNDVNGRVDLTGGVYITPYYGGLNNPNAMDNIYCVDPNHDSYLHTYWHVDVTPLADGAIGNTYLGIAEDPNALTKYEEAAYLLFDYRDSSGYTYGPNMPQLEQQVIQAAIWHIVSPANDGDGYGQYQSTQNSPDTVKYYVGLAGNEYKSYTYSNVSILTPLTTGPYATNNQEFMTNTPVPEPSTMLLLGSGLIGLWGFRKRVRKS